MSEERKRRSLADTLRATSPIAGDALAGAASAMRRISAPQDAPAPAPDAPAPDSIKAAQATFSPVLSRTTEEAAAETAKAQASGKPYQVGVDGHALPEKPRRKSKPLTRPVIEPVSQPVSQSLGQSASHSTSQSASLSLAPSSSQSLGQSVGQSSVADRLTENQRTVLRHLIETRPYIVRFAQLGQAVGLGEATTRTILRRLAALDFIKFQRARDGQVQGVSIGFNATLCEQFTQGQSLDHSQGQPLGQPVSKPVTRPLTSRKIDLETVYPSEEVTGKLAKLTDEQLAFQWPNLAAVGFGANELARILESLTALGRPTGRLVEGLDHADHELRTRQGSLLDAQGQTVTKPAGYIFNSLARTGYYRRPEGYTSPAEQAEKDAAEDARRVLEARKAREDAEFSAWVGGLTNEERDEIRRTMPPGPEDIVLKAAWRKQRTCR